MITGNGFGARLRTARQKKGLKQIDVAKVLECAGTSITNYEAEKIQPSFDVLARLCDVLEISALDLLDKRYTYTDIMVIAQKPVSNRSYQDQIALNFCGAILEKTQNTELKRLDKERENRAYISEATGLTYAAVSALTVDADTLFRDEADEKKVSSIALDAVNRLLSCPKGLKALEQIALFLRSGEYRFSDGSKYVSIDAGKFSGPGGTINHKISFSPDMLMSVARNELVRLLDDIRTHLPQEELEEARDQLHAGNHK